MKKHNMLVAIALLPSLFIATMAAAQVDHSDAWLLLEDNRVTVSATNLDTSLPVLVDATTGLFLFPADLGDLNGGPFETDNPGFQSNSGIFTPGARLNYRAIGALQFWDGDFWVDTVPDMERIQIDDNGFPGVITTIDASGVSNPEGFIDAIAVDGSVHRHVDYIIDNSLGVNTLPAFGAYLFELQLRVVDNEGAIVHNESDPIRVVLNFQLSDAEFNEAIEALTSPPTNVPVPGYAVFLLFGLLALAHRFVTAVAKKSANPF